MQEFVDVLCCQVECVFTRLVLFLNNWSIDSPEAAKENKRRRIQASDGDTSEDNSTGFDRDPNLSTDPDDDVSMGELIPILFFSALV